MTGRVRAFGPGESVALLLGASFLVLLAAGLATITEMEAAQATLDARADDIRRSLQSEVDQGDALLAALGALYQASAPLSSTQLTSIADDFRARYPGVAAVGYATLVTKDERLEFERRKRREGLPGFSVRDWAEGRGAVPVAQAREEYLALSLLQPLEPRATALLGVDLLGVGELATALEQALGSGRVTARPARLLAAELTGYLMMKATYYGEVMPASVPRRMLQKSGAFVLLLDLSSSLAALHRSHPLLDIQLEDTAHDAASTAADASIAAQARSLAFDLPPLTAHRRVDIHGHQLRVHVVRPLTHAGLRWPRIGAAALLALVLVLIAIGAIRSRRDGRLRALAAREELFNEKERAQVTLASIGDAVITCDEQTRVQYLNPVAVTLLGGDTEEWVGRPLNEVLTLVEEVSLRPVLAPPPADLTALDEHDSLLLLCRNGTTTAADVTVSKLRGRGGERVGTVLAIRDVSRERHLASELAYQAAHDPLTGLANRREYERCLDSILEESKFHGTRHALCYIDLDQFKLVNDTCGHTAGDQLLRQVGSLLLTELRDRDVLARLGGDEFGVLLSRCAPPRAREVAERLRCAVERHEFQWEDHLIGVSASIGVVPIDGRSNIAELQATADLACYAAKDRGRNCIHVYEPGDQVIERRHGEMQWHARIRRALQEGRFVLYWQPMLALREGLAPDGMTEFLVRMRAEGGELIAPNSFIPAAERYGLMGEIDRWVILSAMRLIVAAPARAPALCTINLSGQSVGDAALADFIGQALTETGLDPSRLCFEITETAAIANFATAVASIQRLRGLGCRFALDDFGAGLSSLGYLKQLPVDYLKIDGQFVRNIESDDFDFEMVKGITALGRSLGVGVIAEMVSSERAVDLLRELGVDYAQGFHIARPEPAGLSQLSRPVAA